jgi:hypothetical protein
MSKEKDMVQPNRLGHYHRDIKSFEIADRYYMRLVLSCNHNIEVSKQVFKKHKDHAFLCSKCSRGKSDE